MKKVLFLIFILFSYKIFSENQIFTINTDTLPELTELKSSSDMFKDYCKIVEENYKRQSSGKDIDFGTESYFLMTQQPYLISYPIIAVDLKGTTIANYSP
ncbi:MAG: hypothetical protein GX677_06850, partial [Treponema sp.]|nr:hypothetical protein [Treponema sp.]